MNGRGETRSVHYIGVRCHCFDVQQTASTDSHIRFAVRVHRVSRRKSLGRQNRFNAWRSSMTLMSSLSVSTSGKSNCQRRQRAKAQTDLCPRA
jgi:hypothetical protein